MNLNDAMAAVNIPAPPANAQSTSGKWVRYGKRNRYWFMQQDGVVLFGDWTTGERHHWFENNNKPMSSKQKADQKAKVAQLIKAQKEEETRLHEEVAARCEKLWGEMPATGNSSYLQRKKVEAYGLRYHNNRLVIPLRDVTGKLWSLQYISNNGSKLFEAWWPSRVALH